MLRETERGHAARRRLGAEVDDPQGRSIGGRATLRRARHETDALALVGVDDPAFTSLPRRDAAGEADRLAQEERPAALHRQVQPCDRRVIVARGHGREPRGRRRELGGRAFDVDAVERA